jgi:hypothetical protein
VVAEEASESVVWLRIFGSRAGESDTTPCVAFPAWAPALHSALSTVHWHSALALSTGTQHSALSTYKAFPNLSSSFSR